MADLKSQEHVTSLLYAAAETGDEQAVKDVLRTYKNVPLPIEVIEDLPNRLPITLPDAVVTMPYAGMVDMIGKPQEKGTLKAYQLAKALAESSEGKVAIIDNTPVGRLMDSPEYTRALFKSLSADDNIENLKAEFAKRYNGTNENFTRRISNDSLWDKQSARFMIENPLPQVGITAFAKPTSIYGNTEYPTIMNEATTPTLEGVSKSDYAVIKESGGSIHDMRSTTSLLSAHNIGAIEYGYDAEGKLHLDTHAFWGDAYPDIPRTNIPDTVTDRKLVSDVMMGITPYEAKTLNRGVQGLEIMQEAAQNDSVVKKLWDAMSDSEVLQKALRFGKNSLIGTGVFSAVSVAFMKSSLAAKLEYAEKNLSPKALGDFQKLVANVEDDMLMEAGDPVPYESTLRTVAVEVDLQAKFQKFLDENPDVSPAVAAELQLGMLDTDSVREVLDVAAIEAMSDADMPPEIFANLKQAQIDLNTELDKADQVLIQKMPPVATFFDGLPREIAATQSLAGREAMAGVREKAVAFREELQNVISSPEGLSAILSHMGDEQVVKLSKALALRDNGDLPPELAAVRDTQHMTSTREEWLLNTSRQVEVPAQEHVQAVINLSNHPDVARSYLETRLLPVEQENLNVDLQAQPAVVSEQQNSVVFLPPNLQALKDRMGGELPEEFQPKIPTGTPLYHLDAVQNWELQIREENNLPFIHLSTGLLRANDPYVDFDEVEIRDFQNTLADPDLSQDVIDLIETGYPAGMERLRSEELERLDKAAGQKLDDLYRLDWQKQQAEFDTRQEHPVHMGLE